MNTLGYRRRLRNDMRQAMTVRSLRSIARREVPFGYAVEPAIPGAHAMTKAQLIEALDAREERMRDDGENWAILLGQPRDIVAETERGVMSVRLSARDSRRFDEIIGEMRNHQLMRELETEEGFTR